MDKLQVVAFALVVAIVVGIADYAMQSRKTGQKIGQMAVATYIDTVKLRYDNVVGARLLAARQKQLAKIHLPEAPEGWQRREWADGDNSPILPSDDADTPKEVTAEDEPPLTADAKATALRRQNEVWVYRRGDEVISLRAVFNKEPDANGASDFAKQILAAGMQGVIETKGYAFIKGVAYGQETLLATTPKTGKSISYRSFSASMGGNIRLDVRAQASDASIRALLAMIDYDGLNAMLDQPLEYVGSTAVDYNLEQQAEIAQQLIDDRPVQNVDRNEIETGLHRVQGMPGQECRRNRGHTLCNTVSE